MVQIRQASQYDLHQLLEIIAPFFSPGFHWSEGLFRSEFHNALTWVIEQDSQIQGFVCLRDVVDAWEISVLATRKESQGKGMMTALLRDLIQRYGEKRHLWLEVHETNLGAQKLYEKLGFKHDGNRGGYYKDGSAAMLYSLTKKQSPS